MLKIPAVTFITAASGQDAECLKWTGLVDSNASAFCHGPYCQVDMQKQ